LADDFLKDTEEVHGILFKQINAILDGPQNIKGRGTVIANDNCYSKLMGKRDSVYFSPKGGIVLKRNPVIRKFCYLNNERLPINCPPSKYGVVLKKKLMYSLSRNFQKLQEPFVAVTVNYNCGYF